MRGQRLVERLQGWKQEPLRRTREAPNATVASVVSYLHRILNTRQGSADIAGELGLPDMVHLLQGYPQSVREIQESICTTIRRFEPRLCKVQVHFAPCEEQSMLLHFHICARLAPEGEPVVLDTMLGPDGRVQVRS